MAGAQTNRRPRVMERPVLNRAAPRAQAETLPEDIEARIAFVRALARREAERGHPVLPRAVFAQAFKEQFGE